MQDSLGHSHRSPKQMLARCVSRVYATAACELSTRTDGLNRNGSE